MKKLIPNTFRFIPAALCLLFCLLANHAGATFYTWDPIGTSTQSPYYTGSLSGTWENASWASSNTSSGQATPQNWLEGADAIFAVNSGTGTPAFTVTMTANHTVAGIFDGPENPNPCLVTINGTGTLTLTGTTVGCDVTSDGGNPGSVTINNVIAGTSQLWGEGGGSIILNGANTYSGGFNIDGGGGVSFGNNTAFGSGTISWAVAGFIQPAVAGTTYNIANPMTHGALIETFSGNTGGVTFSGNWTLPSTGTTTLENISGTITVSGIISCAAALTINHASTGWSFTGANTYTGNTTITAGTLTIGNPGSLGSGAYAGAISIASGATFTYASSTAQTLSGVISGAGALIVNNSAAVLTLSGADTYTGATTIQSGTLQLNRAGGPLPSTATLIFGGSGTAGILDMDGRNQTVASLAVASGATAANQIIENSSNTGNSTLTVSGGGTFNGILKQGPGSDLLALTVSGNTLTLGGANTYTGSTTINSGATLTIGSAGQLGGGSYAGSIADNGAFVYSSSAAQTLSAVISGTGTLTQNGSGALTLSGTGNTYSGITTINGGYLYIARDLSLGAAPGSAVANQVTLNCTAASAGLRWSASGQTLAATRGIYLNSGNIGGIGVTTGQSDTIAGPISGPGNFKSGFTYNTCLGTNVLTGLSTYTGTTTIAGGRLMLGISGALPSGTPLTIAADNGSGGVFDLGGFSQTIGTLTSSTGIGGTGGPGIPTIVLSGALTVNETSSTAFAGQIIGSGGSLTLNGTGTLTLGGINTYTGGTTISAGTLDGSVAGSIPGNVTVTSTSGTALELDNTSAMAATATLTLPASPAAGAVNLNLSGGTQTINALYFGSTPQATGTWGASGSGAANISSAFTGNGLLQVNCTAPAQTITPAAPAVCAGSTGNIASVPITAGATYAWSIAGGTITAGGTSSTVTYTAGVGSAVTLNCVVTASCGIASAGAQNASVTINPLPTVSVNSQTVCANALPATVTATPAGGTPPYVNYAWTVPAGATAPGNVASFTTSVAGTYSVVVTDNNGCSSASGSGTLTVNGAPAANAGLPQTICSGCSATLGSTPTASGGSGSGYTYSWSPSAGLSSATVANPTASPSSTTTYAVTVTDGNGCVSAPSSVTVTVANVAPAISGQPGNTTVCSGSTASFSVTASGSSLNYSWAVNNNSGWGSGNGWTLGGTGGGTFLDTSTDNEAGGSTCSSFSSALDIDSPLHNQALGMYDGDPSGSTFATRTFPALTAGQVVSVDFDNGWVDTGRKVGFSLQTSASADVLQFYFNGGDSFYTYASDVGSPTPTTVNWQNTGLRVQFALTCANTYVLTVTPCGGTATTYTGTYSGATITQLKLFNGNTDGGGNYNVFFNNLIVGGYTDNADNYYGNPLGWSTLNLGNQPIATGNGGSSYTTPALAVGDSGTQYEVVVAGCGGAVLSSVASVTVNPLPTVSVNSQTVCAGGSATLTATTSALSPSYLWNDPGNSTTASITVSPASTTTYTVTVTETTTLCANSGSGTVTVNPTPAVSVNSQTICAGGPATLTATTSALSPSYLWSPGGATTASITVSPASTTTYTVTVTDGTTSCANNGSGTVTVNPQPTVSVNSVAICGGGSATLTATTSALSPSYLWSPGGATTASITVSPASTTTYTVTVTETTTLCANSGSGTVTVNSAPTAAAASSQTVCAGDPGVAIGGSPTASGGTGPYTYLWAPATGLSDATVANPTAEVGSTTTYTVTVTDANGCTANASVVLTVPPLPNIESTTLLGSDVTLVWDSLAGQVYRVQYTTDLPNPPAAATWTDLTPDVTATGATATYTDTGVPPTQRFYRIFIVCP
jgi:autotransporter-associated beta strand protein